MKLEPGAVVIVHLSAPSEKLWGVLEELGPVGVTLRGINLSSFDEWVVAMATEERPSVGLVTMFVPLFRVERIFLDEEVGEVESYCQRFARRVGRSVHQALALP